MPSITPSRFPSGITNVEKGRMFGPVQMPDPTRYHVFFDDFDRYVAADWTVTETQAGATQALADLDGGCLVLTNSAADDDVNAIQKAVEGFRWEANRMLYGKCRFKVSDATQSDLGIGLSITDASVIASAPTDAFYFLKADGAATMVFKAGKNSTYSTSGTVLTLADNTFYTIGFTCDGVGYVSGGSTYYGFRLYAGTSDNPPYVTTLSVVSTNMCDDEDLTPTFALQNGEAVAKIATIDYLLFGKARF